MTDIVLSPSEIQMAAFVGCQRAVQNIQNKETYSVSGEKVDDFWQRMIVPSVRSVA